MKGSAFKRRKLIGLTAAALAVGSSISFTATAVAATPLNGAGSTLVQPLEAEWASAFFAKTGISVNYQGVGSGTGITDISTQQSTFDFGASDAPLTSSQAAGCPNCIQIPWALSATGVGFNVPGVKRLRLSGPVLAAIYLGQITKWDAPQIAKLNKGVKLPNLTITPVHRSDGSGDTYAFTDFLSRVSRSWVSTVGQGGPSFGTSVGWPQGVGLGAAKNAGIVGALATPGTIGYVAVSYLIANSIPAAAIENAAGEFEYPNLNNIENAAQTVHSVPSNDQLDITDPARKAKIAYPISTFTYVIAPTTAPNGGELKQFIQFALGPGQHYGAGLDFASLPKVVVKAAEAAVNRL